MGKKAYSTLSSSEERSDAAVEKAEAVVASFDVDAVSEEWIRGEVQPPAFRDKKFAIAFLFHLALIVSSAPFAPSVVRKKMNSSDYYRGRTLQRERVNKNKKHLSSSLPQLQRNAEYDTDVVKEGLSDFEIMEDYYAEKRKHDASGKSAPKPELELESVPESEPEIVKNTESIDDYYEGESFIDDGLELDTDPNLFGDGEDDDLNEPLDFIISSIVAFILASTTLSMVLTLGALYFLQHHAERVIKCSIFFTIGFFLCLGIWAAPSGSYYDDDRMPIAIIFFIVAIVYVCYAVALWKKIPFAASTLSTGVTACKANLGVFGFAFLSPMLYFVTCSLQVCSFVTLLDAIGGLKEDPSDVSQAGTFILSTFLLLSIYWTSEVIKNISTVTVSGTVGTWWFSPVEASSFCSSAVVDSFKRAITYSFGSICFGSLIVAILNVLIHYMRRLRRHRGCILLLCVIQCILTYLERLVEYFNKWAFVYVGLYGYDYMTAGKNVMRLFKSRGWSSVISHSLVQKAMFMVAVCVALATASFIALVGGFFEELTDPGNLGPVMIGLFVGGFYVSIINSHTLLSVVSTASDTTIVCFAEGPAEFEENHPTLSMQMTETFSTTFPEVNFGRVSSEVV